MSCPSFCTNVFRKVLLLHVKSSSFLCKIFLECIRNSSCLAPEPKSEQNLKFSRLLSYPWVYFGCSTPAPKPLWPCQDGRKGKVLTLPLFQSQQAQGQGNFGTVLRKVLPPMQENSWSTKNLMAGMASSAQQEAQVQLIQIQRWEWLKHPLLMEAPPGELGNGTTG